MSNSFRVGDLATGTDGDKRHAYEVTAVRGQFIRHVGAASGVWIHHSLFHKAGDADGIGLGDVVRQNNALVEVLEIRGKAALVKADQNTIARWAELSELEPLE